MIVLHRLKGEQMFLNADLIESIEATPDTVIGLVDGRRVVVADTPEEVMERIVEFRASILCVAERLRADQPGNVVRLHPDP